MSSVTTSTTVRPPQVQPSWSWVGVNSRTLAVPCGRLPGEVEMVQHRRPEVALGAVEQVLRGDVAVVAADQRLEVDPRHRRQLLGVRQDLLEDG